ncbi:MAG: large conductance mechanosensitive channel protein MscL [Bauldia sp.]
MLKEFREFAMKGNMVDLAIGVIIGAAFGGLVKSIVEDILMPIVGRFTGNVNFTNMFIQLGGAPAATLEAARANGPVIAYGNFLTLLINFLIVAWVLFMVVKAMNQMKKRAAAAPPPAPAAPPPPSKEVELLGQIRDLLARR